MHKYSVVLVGVSELFFSKQVFEEKGKNETHEQFDARIAPQKVHTELGTNNVFIQPFAIKNGLESAAKRIGRPVPGQGKATYSKLFRQGIIVVDRAFLFHPNDMSKHINLTDVEYIKMSVPSNGVRGYGRRVVKSFPVLHKWSLHAKIIVNDSKINGDILTEHLKEMGDYIGLGALRVENGGIAGRFNLDTITKIS